MSRDKHSLRLGTLIVGAHTDRGLVREENEDAYGLPQVAPDLGMSRGYLFAVADGVGGYGNGREASNLTITTLYTQYYGVDAPDLLQAIQSANMAVRRQTLQVSEHSWRMGSTLVVLLFQGSALHVAHVGDSRAYLIRQGGIRQLTVDHSLVQEQVQAGILDAEAARSHHKKNVITRAIGTDSWVAVDLSTLDDLRQGDTFVLCSDGLTNHVAEEIIVEFVTRYTPADAAPMLVQFANQNGGSDNITVEVIRYDPDAVECDPVPADAAPQRLMRWRRALLWVIITLSMGGALGYAALWLSNY
jgi:PPM family protein phosphatase